ncbi:DUF4192 domain-containing protein [Actinomadura rudentiformis]|uniref:DUF4192 domain-containing protein n=1 Tax=Actinomadura rudentiformis TaxID=359158 RepID=A0A6H9YR52_9ACTN|nr:DUF4192 domain-containing protein [Actinomadura rudentiformis]KAB2346359.1 DUF4192 domain-containing protein [Actinomadura rudentiformis]
MKTKTPLVIRSPQDAIAAVPYLLGFHPADSLVVIAYDGPHNTCAMRLDLPQPDARAAAERIAALLTQNEFRQVLLLGYGTNDDVAPVVAAAWEVLTAHKLQITEALRVGKDRWWSLTCVDGDCCPPEGRPYDISTTVVAAQATLSGHVALDNRADLARTLSPLEGEPRKAMREATDRAEERFLSWTREALTPAEIQSRLVTSGLAALSALTPDLTDDEVAWLGVTLTSMRVRDEAWIRVDIDDPQRDIDFWRAILRRIEEPYAAAPACLLAIAAYAAGDGGLANLALDRAQDADPTYSLAHLLRAVVDAGIPPSQMRLTMTPETLATAYEDKPR